MNELTQLAIGGGTVLSMLIALKVMVGKLTVEVKEHKEQSIERHTTVLGEFKEIKDDIKCVKARKQKQMLNTGTK